MAISLIRSRAAITGSGAGKRGSVFSRSIRQSRGAMVSGCRTCRPSARVASSSADGPASRSNPARMNAMSPVTSAGCSPANAGMPVAGVAAATCLAAGLGSILMGLISNYPLALAPGMGLNAYFAFGVVGGMGVKWEVALGAVFISGFLFLVLTVTKVREWIIDAIPKSMKLGIAAGIGLFLAIIALENAKIVVAHPATNPAKATIIKLVFIFTFLCNPFFDSADQIIKKEPASWQTLK